MDGRTDISEKTKIPLFAVLSAVPFIVGGIIWLTAIDAKASYAKEQVQSVLELLRDVRERVIRIETMQKQERRNGD